MVTNISSGGGKKIGDIYKCGHDLDINGNGSHNF